MNAIAQTRHGPVEYRTVGQGPVILVRNSGHTPCRSPLGHEPFFLDQGYQLLIPSRPGYGKTPSAVGKTAEAFADVLVSFLDLFQVEQAIVVGMRGWWTHGPATGWSSSRPRDLTKRGDWGPLSYGADPPARLPAVQTCGGTRNLGKLPCFRAIRATGSSQTHDEELVFAVTRSGARHHEPGPAASCPRLLVGFAVKLGLSP